MAGGSDTDAALRLLVVEDNVSHARFVRTVLEAMGRPVAVHQAGRLASACERLRAETFDVVLCDLHLPDGQGASVVLRLLEAAPAVPVIVISALDDPVLAEATLAAGAHDYLPKDGLTVELMGHAIRRAGQRAAGRRNDAVLLDTETGVFNGRGLAMAAAKSLAFARRRRHPVSVLHLSVGGTATEFVQIVRIAAATIRDADLVGRVGARRLAVVLPDDQSDPPAMLGRLQAKLAGSPLEGVALGVEVRKFDPQEPVTIEELLRVAPDEPVGGAGGGGLRRVVVISDDAALVEEVRAALGGGWAVLEAAGAGPAARIAALEEPHLAVVDLAGAEGLAVVRRISEQPEVAGIAIIGVLDTTREDAPSSARAAGLVAFVDRSRVTRDLAGEVERAVRST